MFDVVSNAFAVHESNIFSAARRYSQKVSSICEWDCRCSVSKDTSKSICICCELDVSIVVAGWYIGVRAARISSGSVSGL